MAKGKHAPSALVQVLDAMLLTFNAIIIVAAITAITLMVVVWRSGGAISGGQLLVFAGILLAGLLLAGAEVLLRRAVERIHAAGNRPRSHRQR
jgi:hypothetical protein